MGKKADSAKEEKEKVKAQEEELSEAVEEAQRRVQIAKVEVSKKKKLAQNLRAQKVSLVEQGAEVAETKLPEIEGMLERAEQEWKESEKIVLDFEWKQKRVMLKQRDWQENLKRKEEKKAGKLQGFKIEYQLESQEELDKLLDILTVDL